MKVVAQGLVHGGDTLARLDDGRVVFLQGAAPGDTVEAEVFEDSGRFLRARALRVLSSGPSRVSAPCEFLPRCGGCPVQQIAYAEQLRGKEALAADALERIGGFARGSYALRPIVESPKQFNYRRRARLHRARGGWGFAQAGTVQIEPVARCLLFEPLLQTLADLLGDLPGATDVAILAGEKNGALDVHGKVSRKHLEELARHRLIKGVTSGGAMIGDPVIVDQPLANGARLRSRPDTFAQANRSLVPALQGEVLRLLQGSERVLELYCGSGTLTLPLLGNGRTVTAVESAGPSLLLLRKSADEAGLPVRLIAGDAAKVSLEGSFDAALIDPPRTGAAEAVNKLAAMKLPRVVYVSCDAPTLARDGKMLAQRGYKLVEATPLDLFPQTAHFEVVALFEAAV
ncbi:MAG TPA: TRAM domain-containing protein [Myxococcales bacterium]